MDADAQARLVYLVLLGAGLLFLLMRGGLGLGRLLRTLMVWGLLIAAIALAYTLVEPPRETLGTVRVTGEAVVLTRGRDGHFHAELLINDQPVRFLVDTGASEIVLTQADARAVGIDTDALIYLGRAQTANGIVRTAPVRLGVLRFGDITDTNVRATVSEGTMPGSLLGMSYLDRFERIEIAGNEMRLIR